MAIRQSKSESLVESKLNEKIVEDIKPSKEELDIDFSGKKPKKKRFLASTIDELKKVNWPSINYTFSWSVIIVIFTVLFSLSIGLVDNVFQSGIKYVSCTADNSVSDRSNDEKSSKLSECNTDLVKNLSFRG
jgi:preprotein translocase SecE subunit